MMSHGAIRDVCVSFELLCQVNRSCASQRYFTYLRVVRGGGALNFFSFACEKGACERKIPNLGA